MVDLPNYNSDILNKITIGSDSFPKVAAESASFVDKTLLIKDIIDSGEDAILITRPRRWGKSLNMDMLKTFFEKLEDNTTTAYNRQFFEGGEFDIGFGRIKQLPKLKIAEVDNGSYMKFQGQYPVIFISFKDVVGDTIKQIKDSLLNQIKELFRKHDYLEQSPKLSEYDKNDLKKYLSGNIDEAMLTTSLKFLSKILHFHYGQKVIILVDEYDKPINSLLEKGFDNKENTSDTKEVITTLLSSCGKSNQHLHKIIITGILDILKKEGGSGFNNVKVHGIIDPEFSERFGFSGQEVAHILAKLNFTTDLDKIKSNLKEWYDGYTLPLYNGNILEVYTPWAVVNYVSSAIKGEIDPESYWSRSGTNVFLQQLLKPINANHLSLITKFHKLAENQEQAFEFNKLISFSDFDLTDTRRAEEIFSYLLLNSGYLTARKENNKYYFKLPNLEVKKEFIRVIAYELDYFESNPTNSPSIKNIFTEEEIKKYIEVLHLLDYHLQDGYPMRHVVEAVIKQNTSYLNTLFSQANFPELNCGKSSMNFNLFHLGALAGNKEILTLLQAKCNKKYLLESDKINKLSPFDFAYLGNNNETLQHLTQTSPNSSLKYHPPSTLEKVTCGYIEPFFSSVGTFAIATGLAALFLPAAWARTPNDPKLTLALKATGSTASVLVVFQTLNYFFNFAHSYCDKYHDYNKIDHLVSTKYNSLNQFELYRLDHPNSYLTLSYKSISDQSLNTTVCKPGYTEVTSIDMPLFSYHDVNDLRFSLCEQQIEQ